jgi:hypothetical protein
MALREKDLACGRFYESRAYTSNVTGIFSPNLQVISCDRRPQSLRVRGQRC